ncbi:MAG TPA: putative Ig domain-containing protein, partial [Magnetospirillaceae bacterium]|nr:putative Ig domain-containing protein [Magnetospirillaceae bacterium]
YSGGIYVDWAQAKALGLPMPVTGEIDGGIGFSTVAYGTQPFVPGTFNYREIFDAAIHELGHAMGRFRGDSIMQLVTYSAPGVLAPFQSSTATPVYFSIDGGKTELAPWDTTGYDTGDFDASIGPDGYGLGGGNGLGTLDLTLLTALGYHLTAAPTVTGTLLNQLWQPGQQVSFAVPSTTFYEPSGTVLSAKLSSGAALPSWLTFDPTTQTFSGTPPTGFSSLQVSVTATNGSASASAQFNVYAPPYIAVWIPTQSWTVGETIAFHMPAGTFVDPNGQALTYSALVWHPDTQTYSQLPSWLTFDPATQTLSGVVPIYVPQQIVISIVAQDVVGGVSVQGIWISTDAPPTQTAQEAVSALATGTLSSTTAIYDTASAVQSVLDGLQSMASAGKLPTINLTDTGIPTITVTSTQLSADSAVLKDIAGNYVLDIAAPAGSDAIAGLAGHANIAAFSGSASQYSVVSQAGGLSVTNLASGAVTTLTGITALHFSDLTEIVAQMPGNGTVTTGNITELYSAVLGREPDVAGLAFYQGFLQANPSTSLLTFAQWFLASPEYTGNTAHAYAQSAAGDAQFIIDSYTNLLGRAPESAAIPYYQAVINQFTNGLVPNTADYAAAQKLGHAQVLVYFSASPEFLHDVQITATSPADSHHWLEIV